jgi:AcrR family transcriptional regulator
MSSKGQTKNELLEAAARLFEQNGFKGTSIRDIAGATDTSISNIYHHFGNKEGLWKEIQKSSVKQLPEKLLNAMAGEADALRRFKRLLRAHLDAGDEFRREARIFFLHQDQVDAPRNRSNRDLQRKILDIYVNELTELRKAGYIKTRHPTVMAFNILGVMNWSLRWYRPDGKLSANKVHDEIITFILNGMGISEQR